MIKYFFIFTDHLTVSIPADTAAEAIAEFVEVFGVDEDEIQSVLRDYETEHAVRALMLDAEGVRGVVTS